MSTKKITMVLYILLAIFLSNIGIKGQEITASISCTNLGALNGVVSYQYDVTLKNNTSDQLSVDYTVKFMAGNVVKKEFNHSTILINGDNLTESHFGTMLESDWNLITECKVEWTATKMKQ